MDWVILMIISKSTTRLIWSLPVCLHKSCNELQTAARQRLRHWKFYWLRCHHAQYSEYKLPVIRATKSEAFGLALGDFQQQGMGIFSSRLKENVGSASINLSKSFDKIIIPTELKSRVLRAAQSKGITSRNFVYSGNKHNVN